MALFTTISKLRNNSQTILSDQPAKLRTVPNYYYTEKVANGITDPRATEGKGGLLPLLATRMDEI